MLALALMVANGFTSPEQESNYTTPLQSLQGLPTILLKTTRALKNERKTHYINSHMISCHHHDYIEIACMYRLPVTLRLRDGKEVSGIALDTTYNQDRKECLILEVNRESTLIELDLVVVLKANSENPHFDTIEFN